MDVNAAVVALAAGTYTQNFNLIGTALPDGWDVRTGASASSLGTAESFTTGTNNWANTSGAFKNLSAGDIASTSSTATQAANTNRALGIRQIESFGDPGASFNFNLSTTGLEVTGISIDLMMLSVQDRSTNWSIEYGIGTSPASFTSLGTWSDPGALGTNTISFTTSSFGTALNNQSNIWFRVVALSDTTGSGSRDTVAIDNFSITAVPEPAAALLGGFGLLGLLRRRRSC
jgi:hypothetical protein